MNRKLHAWPALLLIVACQAEQQAADAPFSPAPQRSGQPRATPVVEPAVPPSITSPAELIGEYRVAGVDGEDIDLPYGISASIDGRTIRGAADCVNLAWSYEFTNGQLATARIPVESYARGLNAAEQAVAAAFDSAESVRRMPSNGIEFSGSGHSVLLFSQ